MSRTVVACWLLLFACAASRDARAQLLIAGKDAPPVELEVAQVFGDVANLSWVGVRTDWSGRLALVTPDTAASSDSADAWLRALDYSSRMRVAPPADFRASCPRLLPELIDTGLTEPVRLAASSSSLAGSELELRQVLEFAGGDAGVDEISEFCGSVPAPYRIQWFDAKLGSSQTPALSFELPASRALPRIWLANGQREAALSVLALSEHALSPVDAGLAAQAPVDEPTRIDADYALASRASDYLAARDAWRTTSPDHWLREASEQSPLLGGVGLPGWGTLEPVAPRYLRALLSAADQGACWSRITSATLAASQLESDYQCAGAPELSRALALLSFRDPVLSRYFGSSIASQRVNFRDAELAPSAPLLVAASLAESGCGASPAPSSPGSPPPLSPPGPLPPSGSPSPDTGGGELYVGSDSGYVADPEGCSASVGDGSQDSSSQDSCSGDSSSSAGDDDAGTSDTSDSCSGDSSSSSSDDGTTHDSCSGDSSDGSRDTSNTSDGCGNGSSNSSSSSGDTCSGSSASSSGTDTQELALGSHSKRKPRARVSLLSMIACCFVLPWRRRWRRRLEGSKP